MFVAIHSPADSMYLVGWGQVVTWGPATEAAGGPAAEAAGGPAAEAAGGPAAEAAEGPVAEAAEGSDSWLRFLS